MKKPAENGATSPVADPGNSLDEARASHKKPEGPSNGAARLRATIEASVDCIITIDGNSTILEFNAAAERTFGYAREEVIGESLAEKIIPASRREAHRKGMAALLEGRPAKLLGGRVEMPAMRADGSEFPVELTITRITSQSPPLFTAYLRDITERKRAEEELSNSLALLRAITEGTTDAVFAKNRQGRYIVANTATARFVGKLSDEVIGCDDTALFCPETAQRIMERDRSVMDSGETRTDEDVGTTAEGVFRVYLTTKGPLRDSSGAINGVFGIARDITRRKRDEEKLRESEERFRAIFEQAPLGISEGEIATAQLISANQRYADILGYNIDELRELTFRNYTHPEDLQKDLTQFQRLALGEIRSYTMDKRYIRKDGAIIWVSLTVSALAAPGEKPLTCLAILKDITEPKQAEQKIFAQLEELRRWQEMTLGREDRVRELKGEVNKLRQQLGEPARYASPTQP